MSSERRPLTLGRKVLFAVLVTVAFFAVTETVLTLTSSLVYRSKVTELNPDLAPREDGDGLLRLMTLGDSLTAGQGTAPEYAYPRQLETLLQELNPDARSEVVNLGVFALNTSRLADLLPNWLETWEPDVVVVLSGCNNSWNYNNSHLAELGLLDRPALLQLLDTTRTYRFLRLALKRKSGTDTTTLVRAPEAPTTLASLPRDMQVMVDDTAATHEGQNLMFVDEGALTELFRHDLDLMLATTRAAGAQLIVLTYPFEVNGFEHREELFRWGRANDVVVADLQAAFDNVLDEHPTLDPFSADRGHPNKLGYGVVATTVYEAMAANPRLANGRALAAPPDPLNAGRDVAYLEEALRRLVASLRGAPSDFRLWETRGNIEVELERWEDAERSFRQAFELSRAGPQYVEALSWLYG
ncbi:MAG: hypothetical protein KDA24_28435, partial [Deltaproteobacteria bacterium]|nr:hypothetical protein [Deltaproteobacteria bacterium]